MADIKFTWGAVPRRYQDLVQRYSVLYQFYSAYEDTVAATEKLQTNWRHQIIAMLQSQGVDTRAMSSRDAHKMQYMRNCLPAFVLTRNGARMCSARNICPFCYARDTRKLWTVIDNSFAAGVSNETVIDLTPAHVPQRVDRVITVEPLIEDETEKQTNIPFDLVLRTTSWRVPAGGDYDADVRVLCGLFESIKKARKATIQLVNPAAAMLQVTIQPTSYMGRRHWKVRYGQIYKLTASQEFPEELCNDAAVQRVVNPSRRRIMTATATALRYPVGLLKGDPGLVSRLLQVQKMAGYTRHTLYRGFRGRKVYD